MSMHVMRTCCHRPVLNKVIPHLHVSSLLTAPRPRDKLYTWDQILGQKTTLAYNHSILPELNTTNSRLGLAHVTVHSGVRNLLWNIM